jgi:hypothetical protein
MRPPPFAHQPFRFGGLFGIDAPFTTKGETGAALAGFAVFGLRASLLPRRWDLAIFFSFWRRRAPRPLVASLRRAESQSRAPRSDTHATFQASLKIFDAAWRRRREIVHVDLWSTYR